MVPAVLESSHVATDPVEHGPTLSDVPAVRSNGTKRVDA